MAGEGSFRGGTSCVDGVVMVVRLRWRVAAIACTALLLLVSLGLGAPRAQAQSTTQTPTAAQMEVFKNLPPDQQRMIMQQLQKSGTGKGTQQKKADTGSVIPATQKELTAAEQQEALARRQEPRLRSGDTVIIEVAIRAPGEDDLAQSIAEEKRRKDLEKAQAQAQAKVTDPTKPTDLATPATTREKRKALAEERRLARSPEQIAALEQMRDRIRGGNPYRLDRGGMLHLPGVAGVQLAGLT